MVPPIASNFLMLPYNKRNWTWETLMSITLVLRDKGWHCLTARCLNEGNAKVRVVGDDGEGHVGQLFSAFTERYKIVKTGNS